MTWVLPSLSVTVTVTGEPAGASVVPVMVGVLSLLLSGASTVMLGATVSIEPGSVAVASLPAGSCTVATAVYSPSASGLTTSVL